MEILSRLRPGFRRQTTDAVPADSTGSSVDGVPAETMTVTPEKGADLPDGGMLNNVDRTIPQEEFITPDAQRGVQDVEAITMTWSKGALIAIFINMWMLYFVNAFQSVVLTAVLPYAASAFNAHSYLNVVYVVADSFSAFIFIPLAKIMDAWGRPQGFAFMAVCCTLGLVFMAACQNLEAFCAGYVFYTIGFYGLTYCIDVVTADASRLKNRGLAYAFTASPYILCAFGASKASADFIYKVGWRWSFGAFAIIFPFVAFPMWYLLWSNLKKAKRTGTLVREPSGRNWRQSIWHWTIELDILGVFVLSGGTCLFLLPFDIYTAAPNGFGSGYIIAMFVLGFFMLLFGILYEIYLAPVPMFNFNSLINRTVFGALMLDVCYQISYYSWDNYFTSFLYVVNDLSVADANYIANTFDVVGGVLLFFSGWLMRRTGHFKPQLYFAVPLYTLAMGLMIYFRRPNQNVGYLVMCQILLALGGSIFIIIEQVAILAAVDHQHVAAALALLNVIGTIGDDIGATISGIIWDNTFKKGLEKYLPAKALPDIEDIYEHIKVQLSYEVGTPTRTGIQYAYGYAQTRMLATGTAVMVLGFAAIFFIRNIDVKKVAQVKGMVL